MLGASPMPPVWVKICRTASVSAGPWNSTSGNLSTTRSASDSLSSSTSAMVHRPSIVLVIDPIRWRSAGILRPAALDVREAEALSVDEVISRYYTNRQAR